MLQALREKTSGWIAIVIVVILAIPFAFFGMEQYLFQSTANYAAKVEAPPSWWRSAPDMWLVRKLFWREHEISVDEFRTRFEQARQEQRTQEGEVFDARAFETMESRRRVLDGLIDQAVMRLAASGAGIAVSDARVRQEIQSIPAFQVDGKFDPQRYQLALQSQREARSPQEFQELVRDSLQQALIPTRVVASSFVTPQEIERLMRLLGERRDVSYLVLPPPPPDTGPIAAKDIQDWYREHADDYRAPETVTIEYLEIDGSALPPPAAPDEAALRARYEEEKTRFAAAEQRLASHILIRVEPQADAAAQKAAQDKAAALAAQAKQPGADFSTLAAANSEDPGSKDAGGDLGWIEKGMMPAPFEEALFAMQAGEVRGPIKTDAGWHVVQLREVRSGQQVPFEQAREELARELAVSERERAYSELTGKVVDEVYRNPTSLESAARLAGQPVRKLGPFARGGGTGIAAEAAVQRAAFSEALIQDGTVSDPIELGPERTALIRVIEHAPERVLPLAQVRDRVVAAIRADRAAKAQAQAAEAMVTRLRAGEPLQAIAQERGLGVQDVPALPRGAPAPAPAASEAYFAAPAPAQGKPSAGTVALPDGGRVVFVVSKVIPGDPKDAAPQEREMMQQQLAQLSGNEDARALLDALRRRMKISVIEARLQ